MRTPETWASFDDETKETFKRVMAECSIEEREISRKMDSEAVAELEKQGMTVTYPDKQQFIDKAADLYAQWEEEPTYRVFYDANGGTGTMTDEQLYYTGDAITVKANEFTYTHKKFVKFTLDAAVRRTSRRTSG